MDGYLLRNIFKDDNASDGVDKISDADFFEVIMAGFFLVNHDFCLSVWNIEEVLVENDVH